VRMVTVLFLISQISMDHFTSPPLSVGRPVTEYNFILIFSLDRYFGNLNRVSDRDISQVIYMLGLFKYHLEIWRKIQVSS
jgi:hypothetical protein